MPSTLHALFSPANPPRRELPVSSSHKVGVRCFVHSHWSFCSGVDVSAHCVPGTVLGTSLVFTPSVLPTTLRNRGHNYAMLQMRKLTAGKS